MYAKENFSGGKVPKKFSKGIFSEDGIFKRNFRVGYYAWEDFP